MTGQYGSWSNDPGKLKIEIDKIPLRNYWFEKELTALLVKVR